MRRLLLPALVVASMIACGGVDDPPLGGPYGGTTDPTNPNSGDPNNPDPNNNNNTGNDAGTTQTQKDSGTQQQQQDSGTQQQQQDSGTQQQQQDSGTQQQTGVTWTQVFNSYMAGSTKGRCSACHSQGSSKANLYSWLKGKGYINGASSALVDSNQSCLSWYGGNMPTNGPSSWSQAVSDMNSWAAAGAQNN
jgi:hypothetical protein